jgi:hypothetical protein
VSEYSLFLEVWPVVLTKRIRSIAATTMGFALALAACEAHDFGITARAADERSVVDYVTPDLATQLTGDGRFRDAGVLT